MARLLDPNTFTNGDGNGSAPVESQAKISLGALERKTVDIPIIGETPLIPHKWSEKAKRLMRDKHEGKKMGAKHEAKDSNAEAEAAQYYLEDGRVGMPATAFKSAIVQGVRFYQGITMTQARQAFFVEGEGQEQLVPIEFEDRVLREDTPRNATGVADLRYRYSYFPWSAKLRVTFITSVIDLESLVHLVGAAGNGGVGDWRPSAPKSNTGTFGRFKYDESRPLCQHED